MYGMHWVEIYTVVIKPPPAAPQKFLDYSPTLEKKDIVCFILCLVIRAPGSRP